MDRIIKRWHDMIKINSINGREVDLAHYMAKELESIGIEPTYSYYADDIEKVRPSVYGVLDSGKPGKNMMLIGHIDTVGIADGWVTDPFIPTVVDDKTYGLGSMDMKGGLAAILETLEYYANHKDEFTGKITCCFVSDEEGLSKGTYQLVKEGVTADYAIMAECRYDNVAVGFRGRFSFEVTVKGVAAHASSYPLKGENALITGGKFAAGIEALPTLAHPTLSHGTWCVRHIEGGHKGTLVVPDKCEIFVDRYVVPGEDEASCIKQMEDLATEMGIADKVSVRLKPRDSEYMKSFALEEDHLLVTTLREKYEAHTGRNLPCSYDPSVCDSNILAVTMGIPTVTFGPSGGGMHAANEYGYEYQVRDCAAIYISTVKEILK